MIRAALVWLAMAAAAGAVETLSGDMAVLRGLDKISGAVGDIEVRMGGTGRYGHMLVEVSECRFPTANPSGDAYAYLTIRQDGADAPVFQGWMIASAPALNALDHARYDIWLLRCTSS